MLLSHLIDKVQYGAEPGNVPLLEGRIGEGAAEVRPVGGRYEGDVLPVLTLQVLVVRVRRRLVPAHSRYNISFQNAPNKRPGYQERD